FARGPRAGARLSLPPFFSAPLSSSDSCSWQSSSRSSCVRLSFHSPCRDIAGSFSAFERGRRDAMSQIDRKRSGDCRPTAAGCKLAPILRTDARACDIMRRGDGPAAGIVLRIVAIVIAMLAATATSPSAEINAFVSTPLKAATDELLRPFERANGHTIRASYAPPGALIPRFERGEPVDVFLTDSAAIDELIERGKVVAGRIDLARTGIGIAVRKGAPKPDVS